MKSVSPQEHQMLKEQFWDKNKRLNRPISPHLTIYKPQMTSMLSITHRGTGLAQSVILTGFAVGAIASNSTFPIFLAYLQSWKFGGALIFLGKFAIAWPVTYHLFNGLRHLVSLLEFNKSEGRFCNWTNWPETQSNKRIASNDMIWCLVRYAVCTNWYDCVMCALQKLPPSNIYAKDYYLRNAPHCMHISSRIASPK